MLMKHGPIEAGAGRTGRVDPTAPSVLMKHGPIEALKEMNDVDSEMSAFRADEARPH